MITSFFGGAFFGGEFFNTAVVIVQSDVTPAGGVIGGRRRWALIGDRVYHATDDEIRMLLDSYVAPEKQLDVPEVESKPAVKKRVKRVAVRIPEIVPEPLKSDFARYKRLHDDYMAQMLLEAIQRQDEDDIEVLLLH
jgi:hypothetical protein